MEESGLGERIRQRRMEMEFSLRELGERVGVSFSFLCDIEKGHRNPSAPVLMRIAEVLAVNPKELLELDSRALLMEIKQLLERNPDWKPAFKRLVSAGYDGTLTPEIVLKNLGK